MTTESIEHIQAEFFGDCPDVDSECRFSLFDEWQDHLDAQAEWAETLADPAPFFDRHPRLFQRYWRHFVSCRDRKKSTIRRGDKRAWYPNRKARYVRYHVGRHLDGWHPYWVGMPHGDETRNVSLDIDNHDDWITKNFAGLSLAYLKKLKRTHDALPKHTPWLWCLTSKSWGINIILDIGRPKPSADVHDLYQALVDRHGIEAEVYPMGGHNHRLPFGRDWVVLAEEGPITDAASQIECYLSGRVSVSWEAIYQGIVECWLIEAAQHPEARHTVRARLEELNLWELDGFPDDDDDHQGDDARRLPELTTSAPSIASASWVSYRNGFGQRQGAWVKMIVDLARNGVPCADDLYQPINELAKWLLHVELHEDDDREAKVNCLLMSWLEGKSNGNVSRIDKGELSGLRAQVKRVVARAADSEDFQGAFATMRQKRASGKYTEVVMVAELIEGKSDPERLNSSKESITYNSDNFFEADTPEDTRTISIGDLEERLAPYAPKRRDARERQSAFAHAFLAFLVAKGGDAPISQETCQSFGLAHNNQSDKAIKVMIEAGLIVQVPTGKAGNRQVRRFKAR